MTAHSITYRVEEHWAQVPADRAWLEVPGVAVDSRDRVFVFARQPHAVMIFDRHGKFEGTWGEGVFALPHGLFIGPDDSVYCTDDGDHTVRKFTPDGRLLFTLGTVGQSSDTGATSMDYRTIRRAAGPFHYPTNAALAADGSIYVTDGYGNARVHVFSPEGNLLRSWGEPGSGAGQFHLPHGIAVDAEGRVYIADRENCRIQIFTGEGEYLESWNDIARPSQVFIDGSGRVYIAELGYRAARWPNMTGPGPEATGGRVSVFNLRGELLSRWGGGDTPCAPGDFFAPHDICVDSRGDIYVAEVTASAGVSRGLVPAGCHTLQKFVRASRG